MTEYASGGSIPGESGVPIRLDLTECVVSVTALREGRWRCCRRDQPHRDAVHDGWPVNTEEQQ